MRILVSIPAYNEEEIIVPTVEAVADALYTIPDIFWHIVVVDNASTDGTAERIKEKNLSYASVITLKDKGKGLAIRKAAELTDMDIFCFIDADLSADPSYIRHLLEEIKNGANVAIGSRLLDRTRVKRGALRTLSSLMFNTARKMILGIRVSDSQCGLKLMDKKGIDILLRCSENTWFLDVELLARATRNGLRIAEIPIAWEEGHYEGRVSKLSVVRDGFGALLAFFRIRRNMRVL